MPGLKIWGATHPPEKHALSFFQAFRRTAPDNIDFGIANEAALLVGRRSIGKNLTHAYPGMHSSPIYEHRRATTIVKRSIGYYGIADMHNLMTYGETTACIDKKRGVSPKMLGFLARLSIRNVLLTDGLGLQSAVDNTMVVELPHTASSEEDHMVEAAFVDLANNPDVPAAAVTDFFWYEHVGDLYAADYPQNTSKPIDTYFQPFEPLPPEYAEVHGLANEQLHMMTWAPEPNSVGCWAEICRPVPVPDASNWPTI
jgi:hypothetical protein